MNRFPQITTALSRTRKHPWRFLPLALAWLLACAATQPGMAQGGSADKGERRFQDALEVFRTGDYALAGSMFDEIASDPADTRRSTAAMIMGAKAYYRDGEIAEAGRLAGLLVDRYPGSSYRDDALYILALCEYRKGHYDIAVSHLTTLLSDDPTSGTADPARKMFAAIVADHLPLSELKRISRLRLPRGLHTVASISLARALSRRDEDSLAVAILDGLISDQDSAPEREQILELRSEIASGDRAGVGVLLPLMMDQPGSEIGRLAREVLDGIRFALDRYNAGSKPGKQVRIEVRDSGRDTSIAADVVRTMASTGWIRAVVGPLFSDVFGAASEQANALRLPIISPTATADHLAENGPFIFQANPDYSTRGRAAARFAVEQLRMSSFAILGSDDPVGRSHAEAFREEAVRLGATVYSMVFFPQDAEDLREQFLAIRRSVMAESTLVRKTALSDSAMLGEIALAGGDTLAITADTSGSEYVSVTRLFGPTGFAVAESLGLPIAVYDTTADETDIPLMALDGMYLPLGDPGQLDYVAPQFNYFNIKAQVIGNNEWYDPERLRDNRAYINGSLFLSDYYHDPADSSTRSLSGEFRRSTGATPTKFTYYGFDTMNLILAEFRDGVKTRNEIASNLVRMQGFRGIHGNVEFGGSRVNRYLHVLQYVNGETKRLGGVEAVLR